ncbi:hypothetical protein PIB30_115872, partial [Stylosanthes scabra]|nr:hypothetical protein [Stylosanthes scabra]
SSLLRSVGGEGPCTERPPAVMGCHAQIPAAWRVSCVDIKRRRSSRPDRQPPDLVGRIAVRFDLAALPGDQGVPNCGDRFVRV